ncbi:hypothetical protein D3C77_434530 [compost metagenome]
MQHTQMHFIGQPEPFFIKDGLRMISPIIVSDMTRSLTTHDKPVPFSTSADAVQEQRI